MIIWLASYPRSGNTLLRIILRNVFEQRTHSKHDDDRDIGADAATAQEVGHLFLGKSWADAYPGMRDAAEPYFVKTHDDPGITDDANAKAIYIVRDGRSVAVSYYNYMRDFAGAGADYTVGDVIAGFTPFGSWSGHLAAWEPQHRPNTLLLRYEDLLGDPKAQIARIAQFIGKSALHEWENNFEHLHRVNPKFFRAGAANRSDTALSADDAEAFWAHHGHWMRQAGYPVPEGVPRPLPPAFVRTMSDRGKESFVARDRLSATRGELQQAYTSVAQERAELKYQLDAKLKELDAAYAENSRIRAETEERFAKTRSETEERFARARSEMEEKFRQERADLTAVATKRAEDTARLERYLAERTNRVGQLEQLMEHQRAEQEQSGKRQAGIEQLVFNLQHELAQERARIGELSRTLERAASEAEAADARDAKHETARAGEMDRMRHSVKQLNSRLQLMCSSRLIRTAWSMRLLPRPDWIDNGHSGDDVVATAPSPARRRADEPSDYQQIVQILRGADARAAQAAVRPAGEVDEMGRLLSHLVSKGFAPKVVLDVGAAKGYWSERVQWDFFNTADFYMIDPLAESEEHLKELTQRKPNFHYVLCAIGREPGTAVMNVTQDCDGSSLLAFPNDAPERQRKVPVETIDRLLEQGRIKPPNLVKIDVQGFEMEVLAGAGKLFGMAEVFIVEVSFYEFMPGNPLADRVVQYMAEHGYRVYDFAGFLHRPYQSDLAQADIVFVRNDSSLVSSNRWA